MIDVSHLDRVISIDSAKRTAIVEPNVPMDQLTEVSSHPLPTNIQTCSTDQLAHAAH